MIHLRPYKKCLAFRQHVPISCGNCNKKKYISISLNLINLALLNSFRYLLWYKYFFYQIQAVSRKGNFWLYFLTKIQAINVFMNLIWLLHSLFVFCFELPLRALTGRLDIRRVRWQILMEDKLGYLLCGLNILFPNILDQPGIKMCLLYESWYFSIKYYFHTIRILELIIV